MKSKTKSKVVGGSGGSAVLREAVKLLISSGEWYDVARRVGVLMYYQHVADWGLNTASFELFSRAFEMSCRAVGAVSVARAAWVTAVFHQYVMEYLKERVWFPALRPGLLEFFDMSANVAVTEPVDPESGLFNIVVLTTVSRLMRSFYQIHGVNPFKVVTPAEVYLAFASIVADGRWEASVEELADRVAKIARMDLHEVLSDPALTTLIQSISLLVYDGHLAPFTQSEPKYRLSFRDVGFDSVAAGKKTLWLTLK
jgi:hypothetical protein